MKYYKMIFKAKNIVTDQSVELIDDYLACLFKNGQIVQYESIYTKNNMVFCPVTLPEKQALQEKYNNEYVIIAKKLVEEFYSISIKELGKNWYLDGKTCHCKTPSFYKLISNCTHVESPITCGDCNNFVPLYKLPKILKEKDFYTVLEFVRECKAIDTLWISGLDDKFMLRQRNNLNSQLVKKGFRLCKEFEKSTGVKFYLHLPFDNDDLENCPFCGKSWTKNNSEYKCDDCQIVAHADTVC